MSSHSKTGGSRASDEDGRTAVKVGKFFFRAWDRRQGRPVVCRRLAGAGHVELTIFSCSGATPTEAHGPWV